MSERKNLSINEKIKKVEQDISISNLNFNIMIESLLRILTDKKIFTEEEFKDEINKTLNNYGIKGSE
jgi:hypothetical protein